MHRLPVLAVLLWALPAGAVTLDWVRIRDLDNPADTPSTNCDAASCGSVDHAYDISKYEVTNAQYAEFLNAKAASDPLGLYNTSMGSDAIFGGITRSGSSGSYTYAVKAGFANKPVNYVSFYDALRFANWLNNGQGSGDTETGAYTLLGGRRSRTTRSRATRARSSFLPSENEWYKAAYYDPALAGYFDYPTGSDDADRLRRTRPRTPANSANCGHAVGRADGRRRLHGLGEPVRHVRPGRERVRVERAGGERLHEASGAGAGYTSPATSPRRRRAVRGPRRRTTASGFVSRARSRSPPSCSSCWRAGSCSRSQAGDARAPGIRGVSPISEAHRHRTDRCHGRRR